jgi:hypothetical protein
VGRGGKVEVYGTAEDEQGVGSAMTRQRRGYGDGGERESCAGGCKK